MEIKAVSTVLADAGLQAPELNVLVPNVDNYKALLLQPQGNIEVSGDFVRNRNRDLAYSQFGKFIEGACQTGVDLAVTPEYSMPWKSLSEALKAGVVPVEGKLWALGCESIKYSELIALRDELSESVRVICEPLDEDDERFLSPLAYVFNASKADGSGVCQTVVLVQFKTHPMGDPDHFEANGMRRGISIYQFGGGQGEIKLTTLICADVFAFEDSDAKRVYDRGLILHIQLNQKPRHESFLDSRRKIFKWHGDATEVICLNWARDVSLWMGDTELQWKNNAASAWYSKSEKFDCRDEPLCNNHKLGCYYTWHPSHHTHTLFFNFEPATFLFDATKVAHVGVDGAVARRRGPQLTKRCIWGVEADAWSERDAADAGFSEISAHSGAAKNAIEILANDNPLIAERVLALCSGEITASDDWYKVSTLDSCILEATEVIRRVTFCQDTDASARDFRIARLARLNRLWGILNSRKKLPASLKGIEGNISLIWSQGFPHQNIISDDGQRATAIYVGEETSLRKVEKVKKYAAEHIRRYFVDDNDRRSALQRLAVWYRDDDDEIKLFEPHSFVQIDDAAGASEFDIGRVG